MDAIDRTTAAGLETMHFGRGGFQAGQATRACAAFYVENVLEELDEGGEYFCRPPQTPLPCLGCGLWYRRSCRPLQSFRAALPADENATGALYYYMNATSEHTAQFLSPQLETLVRIEGSSDDPVVGVHLHNLTFSFSASTYLLPQQ